MVIPKTRNLSTSALRRPYWVFLAPLGIFSLLCTFRPDFFDLLDYVTRRSEKLGFQKKKKRFGDPVNITMIVAELSTFDLFFQL